MNHGVGSSERPTTVVRIRDIQGGNLSAAVEIGTQHIPSSRQQRKDRPANSAAGPSQHYASAHELDAIHAKPLTVCEAPLRPITQALWILGTEIQPETTSALSRAEEPTSSIRELPEHYWGVHD